MAILAILILPVYEHSICFHLFVSCSIFLSKTKLPLFSCSLQDVHSVIKNTPNRVPGGNNTHRFSALMDMFIYFLLSKFASSPQNKTYWFAGQGSKLDPVQTGWKCRVHWLLSLWPVWCFSLPLLRHWAVFVWSLVFAKKTQDNWSWMDIKIQIKSLFQCLKNFWP